MKSRLSATRIFTIHKECWKIIFFLTLLFPLAYAGYQHTKKPYFVANSIIQIGLINGSPIVDPEQLVELLKMKSMQDEVLGATESNLAEIEVMPYFNALNQAKVLRPVRNIQISFQAKNAEHAKDTSLRLAHAIVQKLLSRDEVIVNLDSEAEASIKSKLSELKTQKARLLSVFESAKLTGDSSTANFSQNILILSIIGGKESEINFLESELVRLQKNLIVHSVNKSRVYFKSLDSMNVAGSIFEIKLALMALLGYIIGLGISFIKEIGFKFG